MSRPCRRAVCTGRALTWLGDWCAPTCQWLDLGESGVDLRATTEFGVASYTNLRLAVRKTDPEIADRYAPTPTPVPAVLPHEQAVPAPTAVEPAAVAVLDPPEVHVVPDPPTTRRRTIRAFVRKWVLG